MLEYISLNAEEHTCDEDNRYLCDVVSIVPPLFEEEITYAMAHL
jgi:hypothetical protein